MILNDLDIVTVIHALFNGLTLVKIYLSSSPGGGAIIELSEEKSIDYNISLYMFKTTKICMKLLNIT